jgi:hypothetical protein
MIRITAGFFTMALGLSVLMLSTAEYLFDAMEHGYGP